MGQPHGLLLPKIKLASHCSISNHPTTEINAELNVATFPVMISQLPDDSLVTKDYFNIRMGTVLFFLG